MDDADDFVGSGEIELQRVAVAQLWTALEGEARHAQVVNGIAAPGEGDRAAGGDLHLPRRPRVGGCAG